MRELERLHWIRSVLLLLYDISSTVPLHLHWRGWGGGTTEGITSLIERHFHVHIGKDWSFPSQCMHEEKVVFFYSARTWSMILIGLCLPVLLKHKLASKWSFFFFLDNDQSWTERASGGSEITRSCSPFILPSRSNRKVGLKRRVRMID